MEKAIVLLGVVLALSTGVFAHKGIEKIGVNDKKAPEEVVVQNNVDHVDGYKWLKKHLQ
mgnify:FL=1